MDFIHSDDDSYTSKSHPHNFKPQKIDNIPIPCPSREILMAHVLTFETITTFYYFK